MMLGTVAIHRTIVCILYVSMCTLININDYCSRIYIYEHFVEVIYIYISYMASYHMLTLTPWKKNPIHYV